MATLGELVTLVTQIFGQNIKPQLQQIANLEIVKYVNTGDRVKDGALVLVANSFITVLFSTLYFIIHKLYKYIMVRCVYNKENTYKIDLDAVLKTHTYDAVGEYKFTYELLSSSGLNYNEIEVRQVIMYIKDHNVVRDLNSQKLVSLRQSKQYVSDARYTLHFQSDYNSGKLFYGAVQDHRGQAIHYFIPIHKYYNIYNEEEYIFLKDNALYSKSEIELSKFVYTLISYVIEKNKKEKVPEAVIVKVLKVYEVCTSNGINGSELGELNTNITFDTIYFDEKQVLLDWANKFKTNTLYPKRLSLVNKLGILLYGPPGTGKTGCICALANYLKRDIIIVNTLNVRGCLQTEFTNYIKRYQKTHIFVFDEFDYILNAQSSDTNESEKYHEMLANTTCKEEKCKILDLIKESKSSFNSPTLDIRFILSLLDGIGNDTDRIIIATTNNPDKINPAFLRPGRFDAVLKLGFCSFTMLKDIIQTKFEELNDEYFEKNRTKLQKIVDLNITPLNLINRLVVTKTIDELLEYLGKMERHSYTLEPKSL